MPRRTPTPESSQSIPEMLDELLREEIAGCTLTENRPRMDGLKTKGEA